MLLPYAVNATPTDCTLYQRQDIGHANTYIVPSANIAVGDGVGIVRRIEFRFRCIFALGYLPNNSRGFFINLDGISNTYSSGVTYELRGINHDVITTAGLEAYGLGFVSVFNIFLLGFYDEYITSRPADSPMLINSGKALSNKYGDIKQGSYNVTSGIYSVEYRLVKINDNFTASGSVVPSPFVIANLKLREANINGIPSGGFSTSIPVSVNIPTFHFAQRTCATPYVDDGVVRLPMVNQNDLPSVGSMGPEKEFILKVDCPTDLGYLGYRVQPVHGIADGLESLGVININPASTAKGIGLQITTKMPQSDHVYSNYVYWDGVYSYQGEYKPIEFGVPYGWSSSYSRHGSGAGGDPLTDRGTYQTIPLRVKVYRAGDIVPGNYTAAIWVYMVYR